MQNELAVSFDDLVAYRKQLQSFCSAHHRSLMEFKQGISFKLYPKEDLDGSREARHISSSATCIESLFDCPDRYGPKKETRELAKGFSLSEETRELAKGFSLSEETRELAKGFSLSAMDRPHDKWRSDGSAEIYCRCRALPLIVSSLRAYQDTIEEHLKCILRQLEQGVSRLAIGEAAGDETDDWYPANAFHTYWTLSLLESLEKSFPKEFGQIATKFKTHRFNIDRLRAEMLMWAKHTAGFQIALHSSQSSTLDSDQLAWSVAILIHFDHLFQANLAQQEFVRHGLKCLFEEQTTTGIWRTGAPLFHYVKSGNAYCYVFETFSVLLKGALTDRKEGVFLRQILRPYVGRLLQLWLYAKSTEIPLAQDGRSFGWSSGHRPNRLQPESWATASVYSFSQHLRRLLGIWTREEAVNKLHVSIANQPEKDSVEQLAERGDTWSTGGETAASQLMTLFVNPTRFFGCANRLEPDSQPVKEDQARAAILFGPPGTSKTTLSKCVADAIGWDYVELHASHFVADGLPNVQRTANMIFENLLQLDRTVILFDEIDELVRARDMEPDAFGRFLTTSMLPKLAELWKLRKVIYFVATNYIGFFDPAVTRAQRFDALIHVSPPSFERKIEKLKGLLQAGFKKVIATGLVKEDIDAALADAVVTKTGDSGDISTTQRVSQQDQMLLPRSCSLAKLLLMRWDQLQELASIIRKEKTGQETITLDRELLESALAILSDPSLTKVTPFREYVASQRYQQHDFSKVRIWQVQGSIPDDCNSRLQAGRDGSGARWHVSRAPFGDLADFPGRCREVAPGVVTCIP